MRSLLQFHVVHCKDAFSPSKPLCSPQCTKCKAFAIPRRVRQFNQIGFGIETNGMRSGKCSNSSRSDMKRLLRNASIHSSRCNFLLAIDALDEYFRQAQCRATWAVCLLSVMYFVNVRVVVVVAAHQ